MHSPVTELAIAVIKKISPAAGMQLLVERPLWSGAALKIPVHPFWRFAIRGRTFSAATAMGEDADHANIADRTGPEKFHPANMMWPNPSMKTDLHDPPTFPRCIEHGAALIYCVAGGLFDEDMGACLCGCNRLKGMPVIRRGDEDDLWLLLFE